MAVLDKSDRRDKYHIYKIWAQVLAPSWLNSRGTNGKIMNHIPEEVKDKINEELSDFVYIQGAQTAFLLIEEWMTKEGLSFTKDGS